MSDNDQIGLLIVHVNSPLNITGRGPDDIDYDATTKMAASISRLRMESFILDSVINVVSVANPDHDINLIVENVSLFSVMSYAPFMTVRDITNVTHAIGESADFIDDPTMIAVVDESGSVDYSQQPWASEYPHHRSWELGGVKCTVFGKTKEQIRDVDNW